MKELCYVIPRIDPHDFERYRDDLTCINRLRNKILGISDNYIIKQKTIDDRVEDYVKEMENIRNARELKTFKKPSFHKTNKELDAEKKEMEHKHAMVIKAIDNHANH